MNLIHEKFSFNSPIALIQWFPTCRPRLLRNRKGFSNYQLPFYSTFLNYYILHFVISKDSKTMPFIAIHFLKPILKIFRIIRGGRIIVLEYYKKIRISHKKRIEKLCPN